MRFLFIITLALGLAGLSLIPSSAPAQTPSAAPLTPTRWGGSASSNMVSSARNLPDDPGKVTPLWKLKVASHQYSIPTIDGDRIILGTNDTAIDRPGYKPTKGGALICLDRMTGKLVWRLPSPRYFPGVIPPYHFDQWSCGICSGPVVDGDRVYVVGSRGEVLCLDREGMANGNDGPFQDELKYMNIPTTSTAAHILPTDADIIWKFDLIPQLDVVLHDVCGSTILLQGDYLYICTSNGIDNVHKLVPRPLAPSLIVLDKKTGRLVAKDDEQIGRRLMHCNWCSPCAGEAGGKPLIFFGGGDGILYAFEPPRPSKPGDPVQILKKVWQHDCNPQEYRFRDGKPIPHSTDRKKTTDGPAEIMGVPVFDHGRVYATIGESPLYGVGQGCLSCLDAATGKEIWSSRLVERTLSNIAIADGLLYIPDYTGNLHCFDAATGQRYWVHNMEGKNWTASPLVADGKVFCGTENNLFWVLKAGREKEVLSRTKLDSPPMAPAAADGVLYIPTQLTLTPLPSGR